MDRNQNAFLPFCTCSFAQKMANGRLLFLREREGGMGVKMEGGAMKRKKREKRGNNYFILGIGGGGGGVVGIE